MENILTETEKINPKENTVNEKEDRYIFQYTLSFIVPFIAFILGTLLLTRDEKKDRLRGKICILMGVISVCVFLIISRL